MTDSSPTPEPRIAHHLLLCATPSKPLCCDPELGARCWQTLKQLLRQQGLEDPDRPEGMVLRTKVDCLRVCRDGPVLLIWPEGTLYTRLDPQRLERIVHDHLIGGRPIEAWIERRLNWQRQPPDPRTPR